MGKGKTKIEVRNLTKKFGDLLVLDRINFDIHDGEFLCVVGPTGCGKTTFCNVVTKLIPITFITSQQNILYSSPLNRGSSAMPWAIPIVKGFKIAPAKPSPAATKHIATPVIES